MMLCMDKNRNKGDSVLLEILPRWSNQKDLKYIYSTRTMKGHENVSPHFLMTLNNHICRKFLLDNEISFPRSLVLR